MIPGIISPLLSSGGSGDVEPDAVSWADLTSLAPENSPQTISGITQAIYLRVDISGVTKSPSFAVTALYAYVGSSLVGTGSIYEGEEILVGPINPGDSVYFSATGEAEVSWYVTWTSTIKFKSNGSDVYDQTLDTFTGDIDGPGSGGGGGA